LRPLGCRGDEEKHVPAIEIGGTDGGSRQLRGYVAVPGGDGPWPGVVAIHEAYGLNSVVHRQADRLAAAGYLTLAPDLYSDGGAARCVMSTFRAMLTGRGTAIADVDAARDHLRKRDDCTGKIGIIGFCMGGGFALVTANRGFDVASSNYGPLPMHLEKALAGACPVVGSYGGKDRMLPGAANKLTRTLVRLGVEHDVKVYPSAGHSFLNDTEVGPRPILPLLRVTGIRPEPGAAADAWQRIDAFFAKYLG
jgi:carboxymethylenebutenolidase